MTSEDLDGDFRIQVIRGLPFPFYNEFCRRNIEDAMDYRPKDGDIVISSYPKSGTTWLEYIVLQIVSRGEVFPTFDDLSWKVVPFMELTGTAVVEAATQPRIYKHHFPYSMVQKNPKSKCLYIYRNPEDVLVSYYYFLQSYDESVPLDFDRFFQKFMTGGIGYGRCFEHVLSFYIHRQDPNLLMLSYENLHANARGEVLRLAKFLGEEYYQSLVQDETLLSKIIANTSFKNMKSKLFLTHPDYKKDDDSVVNSSKQKTVTFFRRGTTGDGKRVLSASQREMIWKTAKEILKNTTILKEWFSE